jgi:putative endonuclease
VSKHWKVYIVKCANGALYTGIALDVQARIAQHNSGKGAKAILALGRPVTLQWYKIEGNKSDALKLEAAIKKKTRAEKLKIIENQWGPDAYVGEE